MSKQKPEWTPLDFTGIRTTPLGERCSKVQLEDLGQVWTVGDSFASFVEKLPGILAADQLRLAVAALTAARRSGRTIILGMGAHPIKVGLSPLLVDAIERGLFTGLAINGATIIHDVEMALVGKTSEDVGAHLHQGRFGMARETAEFIHQSVASAHRKGNQGLGQAIGESLLERAAPYRQLSILASAAKEGIPVTVHVALGTDIVHMHPAMDGAATGALSYQDFKLFCRLVSTLEQGVYINLGSAVILPEVFLKAVSVVRNLGYSLAGITTVSMDFQRQYRVSTNVAERPTAEHGTGIVLIGHHEIMFPLLLAAVWEQLAAERT